ncbi:hypothetical protein AADS62_004693 [Escherichia coli]
MQWKIVYLIDGQERQISLQSMDIPHIKAIAFTVYVHEFPGEPRPADADMDVETWLIARGVAILDVQLISK